MVVCWICWVTSNARSAWYLYRSSYELGESPFMIYSSLKYWFKSCSLVWREIECRMIEKDIQGTDGTSDGLATATYKQQYDSQITKENRNSPQWIAKIQKAFRCSDMNRPLLRIEVLRFLRFRHRRSLSRSAITYHTLNYSVALFSQFGWCSHLRLWTVELKWYYCLI